MPMSDKPQGPIPIESVAWTEWSEGVRFGGRARVLSDTKADGRRIGVAVEELPPGRQSCPFHYHLREEEHLIALEGEATLRLGEQRYAIKAGDYVGFPAGQRAGHCLINEGEKTFRYLMVGDSDPGEVCVYPDSNKVLVRALGRAIFRDGARAEYWDGEKAEEPVEKR